MCQIFKGFQLYPEQTRLHEDYYLENEIEQEHHTRILVQRRAQNAANRERNKSGQVPQSELAERKAVERRSEYHTRYIVHTNPEPSDEKGDEHKKFLVIDTERISPYFIAPGVLMGGFDDESEAQQYKDSL